MQEIEFEGIKVQVQRRLFQRSVNLLVKPTGEVKITAGKTASVRYLVKFLESQKSWLHKNLKTILEQKNKYPKKKFIDGEKYLFMGRLLPIKFIEHKNKKIKVQITSDEILLFKNKSLSYSTEDIRKSLNQFYKNAGKEVLAKVIAEKSKVMQLFPKKVSYRAQKTRWGSCSSEGSLSMNWKLIFSPPESIEYVVIHELAHLRYQDHSQQFWSLVENYSPDYKAHGQWLNDHLYEIESYQFS